MPSACLAISYASRRLPQMSTLSTLPPPLRMTLRNVSSDGATVRSSRVGSRMTMISYGRIEPHHLLRSSAATVVPWQEDYLRRQPAQATGTPADLRNRAARPAYTFRNVLGDAVCVERGLARCLPHVTRRPSRPCVRT